MEPGRPGSCSAAISPVLVAMAWVNISAPIATAPAKFQPIDRAQLKGDLTGFERGHSMGRGTAVVLITVAVTLSGLALEGPPLTEVIYGSTAYTLPAGTWELTGYLSLPAILPSVSISYGVTDALQLGTGLSADLLGFLNLGVKLALGQLGPVTLALPLSLAYSLAESTLYLTAGLAMSSQAGPLGLHSELALNVLPGLAPSASLGLVCPVSEWC